jgi:hypothetical protein
LAKRLGRGVESGAMRSDIPPPGRAMAFPAWSAAIVAGIRVFLPDAQAVRKGRRLVIIRHAERAALLANDGRTFWVTFTASDLNVRTTMASLVDDRCDVFTVNKLAHSIAGYFDGRFTRE